MGGGVRRERGRKMTTRGLERRWGEMEPKRSCDGCWGDQTGGVLLATPRTSVFIWRPREDIEGGRSLLANISIWKCSLVQEADDGSDGDGDMEMS